MPTAPSTLEFRVTSVTEAGTGRVNVGLIQLATEPTTVGQYNSNLTLNLPEEDAKVYFPGQTYTVTIAPTTTT